MTPDIRFPCPVCLGVKLEKVTLPLPDDAPVLARSRNADLVLDHCARCGGVWFGPGDVQRLRREDSTEVWKRIVAREGVHRMQCHSCRAPLPRTDPKCGVCGWKVELDCPTCERPLRISEQAGMRLDFCPHCRGVWFDHDELAGIWRMEVNAAVAQRRARALGPPADGSGSLLDVLLYDPFAFYYGAHIAAHAGGAVIEGVAHAGGSVEVIGEVAGAAGEAAAGLFETIVEIIAGIFG